MFTLLRSKIGKRPPPSSTPGTEEVTGLFPPRSAASLLGEPHRQKLLERIWQLTAVSRQQYATLYRARWSDTPNGYRLFQPRKATTTPTLAGCWITDWR